MAVQGTGAMAIIVNDVNIEGVEDPAGALVTLSVLTGVVMILAGYLKIGQQMKFVSNSVMTDLSRADRHLDVGGGRRTAVRTFGPL